MSATPSFKLAATPLEGGTCLIEASAGTGKTFTIAGLFLRLILEGNLSVREILVVTYTEAATEELRGRVRQMLADAAVALDAGKTANPALRDLLASHWGQAADKRAVLQRALAGFDEAPIFTIHGFCQRALRDRAFESGSLFDIELVTDDTALLQEVADDWWRQRFYQSDALTVAFALRNKLQPESFLPLLRQHARHPELRILSPVDGQTLEQLGEVLARAFAAARQLWRGQRQEIESAFGMDLKWARGEHKKPAEVREWFADLELCFSDAGPTPEALASFKHFTPEALEKNTNAKSQTPQHEFFERIRDVLTAERDFITGLQVDFLPFARNALPERKERLKVQSFDDLLTRLRAALESPGGEALAREIRMRYRAALIDEFQDTDPVQAAIFDRLFGSGVPASESPGLFLIGDPKQAIYGFRGADIFTYLDTARRAPRHYSLDKNWRSEAGLVTAVNTLFSAKDNPFVFEDIHFQPVTAAGEADEEPLYEGGRRLPPFQMWFAPRDEDKPISKGAARKLLPEIVASEIVRLLNGDTRLGERRVTPRDIAVLVRKNDEAPLMQEALRARRVPSVLHTEESVFASAEARELQRVLAALAQPGGERRLKAALTTDLLGVNGEAIETLTRDERGWQERVEGFHALHDAWRERGFIQMFRQWLQDEDVRRRLIQFPDGERRLTNVLHLGELLHAATAEQRLGMTGLVRWLANRVSSPERAADDQQLRLERDDEAVRLVTIHKSKGLEYPIVFCPFSWSLQWHKSEKEKQASWHERDAGGRATTQVLLDLGSGQFTEHRRLAFQERLAEDLRLLYVALTRARNRCHFVWGSFNDAGTSAAAWLLHRPATPGEDWESSLSAHFESLDDAALARDLDAVISQSSLNGVPTIQRTMLPEATKEVFRPQMEETATLQARRFTGQIPANWRIASFSSLVANAPEEEPDHDHITGTPAVAEIAEAPATGIFAFPRGTEAGTCLHKIFEELDFPKTDEAALLKLVRGKLRGHGFDADVFAPAVTDMVRRALALPLEPGRPGFTLSRIKWTERLNELEFCFPVRALSPALLRAGFAGSHAELAARLGRLGFAPASGFVKGFIDLVFRHQGRFYIVDWKSNWLGNRVEDYGQAALAREMTEHFYTLQYHLYVVALHRYLALRVQDYDYARHFGGVRYVFLRGLDEKRPEFGIFADRPEAALVESLSAAWAGKGGPGDE